MKMIKNSLLFILFFFSFLSFSQENDFQIWNSATLKKKINKQHNFDVKYGLRFRENASLVSKSFIDLRSKYRLNKKLSLAIGYRNISERSIYSEIENKNRFYFDSYHSKTIKRFSFDIRNRFLLQGNNNDFNEVLRQRFRVSYNLRKTKLEPSVFIEHFSSFTKFINKLRYSLFVSYPIYKKLNFNLGYKIQQEFNIVDPETLFIFETKLIYKL